MSAAKNPRQLKTSSSCETPLEILDPPSGAPIRRWESPLATVTHQKTRRFGRVPTHVVGVANERRDYPRAILCLPLRLRRVAGQREPKNGALATVNISSSGLYFLFSRAIDPGTPIEVEVKLVDRPRGRGSVRMSTQAHVVRVRPAEADGIYGLGVAFDDITFDRDEPVPIRYVKP